MKELDSGGVARDGGKEKTVWVVDGAYERKWSCCIKDNFMEQMGSKTLASIDFVVDHSAV